MVSRRHDFQPVERRAHVEVLRGLLHARGDRVDGVFGILVRSNVVGKEAVGDGCGLFDEQDVVFGNAPRRVSFLVRDVGVPSVLAILEATGERLTTDIDGDPTAVDAPSGTLVPESLAREAMHGGDGDALAATSRTEDIHRVEGVAVDDVKQLLQLDPSRSRRLAAEFGPDVKKL